MNSKRYFLLLMGALGLLRCGLSATQNQWLNPNHNSGNPYSFKSITETSIYFPSVNYKEWSILNAAKADTETTGVEYNISKEGDDDFAEVGADMLRFNEKVVKTDASAWLALGISADEATQSPLMLEPNAGEVRYDNFYVKIRPVPSMEPTVEEMLELYRSYAERGVNKPTSAKLGLYVGDDGYFHLLRAVSLSKQEETEAAATDGDSTTGEADSIQFGFVKSKYSYTDVGGGTITIRIEFQTYIVEGDSLPLRAYRIFAKADGYKEVCLTEDIGYQLDEEGSYEFDFSSLGKGNWFFPLDQAYPATGKTEPTSEEMDSVQQLAFNATAGGFYSAWMDIAKTEPTDNTTSWDEYTLGDFEPFVGEDAFETWAADVGLTNYLDTKENTAAAFNAFLFGTDPADSTPLTLQITGIVPEVDATTPANSTVTLTVLAPEGSEPVNDVARLCVYRAKTLEEMATAKPFYYLEPQEPQVLDSTKPHIVTLVLPYYAKLDTADGDDTQYPFMKVTLLSSKGTEWTSYPDTTTP